MQRFEDKVALVTGAAAGIGRATAERLASEGAAVYCADLHEDGVRETVASIEAGGGTAIARVLDVSDERQATAAVDDCAERLGRLDVLCNIAGIVRMDKTHELATKDWERILAVNLSGTMYMCRAAIPHLLAVGGNIVNTSSTSAVAGMPWGAAYAASKGGVLAMTYAMAVEYGRQGLRVNAVCPGSIETAMISQSMIPEGVDQKLVHRIMPLDRFRGPEVVAAVIAMLASEDGAHVNGERIRVDGATLS